MGWNVGQKLYRDQNLIDMFGNRLGNIGQALFGDCYVLEQDLYGGAWSETWLASRQKQRYVIKTLKHTTFNHPESAEILAQHLRYFNDEAKALANCRHDHIVQIVERLLLPQENNRPCLILEYVAGQTLADWVREQRQLPILEAVKYAEQIGNALIEMHRQGYLHHDVKPKNIMIRDLSTTAARCEAVLIDFGVARQFIPDMVRSYTFTPGSPGFCAPELEMARLEWHKQTLLNPNQPFRLNIEQSEKLDVYSLAATFSYMVTGKDPRNVLVEMPDYIPPHIQAAIKAGMATDPAKRPATVGEWLVMLPLTFRDVYRIQGNVVEYDINDPRQGTYNLGNRKVNQPKPTIPIVTKEVTPKESPKPTRPVSPKEVTLIPQEGITTNSPKPNAPVPLKSAKNIDYRELEQLLKTKQWYEADQLTYRLMLKASGREEQGGLDFDSVKNFPCADLRTIDQLWVHHSDGLYGFSVQKQIYVECGGKLDFSYPSNETWEKFCNRTAWKSEGKWVNYPQQFFNFMNVKGHLPIASVIVLKEKKIFSRIKTCEV
jgi:serine/threonine protein kinase